MSATVHPRDAREVWVLLEALEHQRREVLGTKATAPAGVLERRVAKLVEYERVYAETLARISDEMTNGAAA